VPTHRKTIYKSLSGLPLLENYLGMQARNIWLVDGMLQQMEGALWDEYIRTEKTPFPDIMYVSALSEMWIFALYELLRTWKQLVNEVITYHNQLEKIRNDPAFEEKKKRLLEANKDIQRSTMSEDMEEHFYRRGFRQVELDRSYAAYLTTVLNKVEPIFRTVEELRITLAKHEIPKTFRRGKPAIRAVSPGYARIDTLKMTGALCWYIENRDGDFEIIRRAGIVESIQKLRIPAHKKTPAA
jgi:hypothetical protein